ncbi:MAG: hypothetical protein CMJ48_00240 [Planctomycetaceae bacterium]|nr:hypothetical protein [Planctomycetaceae bacterium]
MELHDALARISEIRSSIAQAETFRGYRSSTTGATSVIGFAGAGLQVLLFPEPHAHVAGWLTLWVGVGAVSVLMTALGLTLRFRRSTCRMTRELTLLAVKQFAPTLVAGGLLTLVLVRHAPQTMWMLPGLWAILMSLGVFASCRLLPRPAMLIAIWYLVTGTLCLAFGQGAFAYSPWAMIVTFGLGQLLAAVILFLTLERQS